MKYFIAFISTLAYFVLLWLVVEMGFVGILIFFGIFIPLLVAEMLLIFGFFHLLGELPPPLLEPLERWVIRPMHFVFSIACFPLTFTWRSLKNYVCDPMLRLLLRPELFALIEDKDQNELNRYLALHSNPSQHFHDPTLGKTALLPLTTAALCTLKHPEDPVHAQIFVQLLNRPAFLDQTSPEQGEHTLLQLLQYYPNTQRLTWLLAQIPEESLLEALAKKNTQGVSCFSKLATEHSPRSQGFLQALFAIIVTPKAQAKILLHLTLHLPTAAVPQTQLPFNGQWFTQNPSHLFATLPRQEETLGKMLSEKNYTPAVLHLMITLKNTNPEQLPAIANLFIKAPKLFLNEYADFYTTVFFELFTTGCCTVFELMQQLLQAPNISLFMYLYQQNFFDFKNINFSDPEEQEAFASTIEAMIDAPLPAMLLGPLPPAQKIIPEYWAQFIATNPQPTLLLRKTFDCFLQALSISESNLSILVKKTNLSMFFGYQVDPQETVTTQICAILRYQNRIAPQAIIAQGTVQGGHAEDTRSLQAIRSLREYYKHVPSEAECAKAHAELTTLLNSSRPKIFEELSIDKRASETLNRTIFGETPLHYAKSGLRSCGPTNKPAEGGFFGPFWPVSHSNLFLREVLYFMWKVAAEDLEHWKEYRPEMEQDPHAQARYRYSSAYALIFTFQNIARSHNIDSTTGEDRGGLASPACNPVKLNIMVQFIRNFSTVLGESLILSEATIAPILQTDVDRAFKALPTQAQVDFVVPWIQRNDDSNIQKILLQLVGEHPETLRAALPTNCTPVEHAQAQTLYCKLLRTTRPVTPYMIEQMAHSWKQTLETDNSLPKQYHTAFLQACIQKVFNTLTQKQTMALIDTISQKERTPRPAATSFPINPIVFLADLAPKVMDTEVLFHLVTALKNCVLPKSLDEHQNNWLDALDTWKIHTTSSEFSCALEVFLQSQNYELANLPKAKRELAALTSTQKRELNQSHTKKVTLPEGPLNAFLENIAPLLKSATPKKTATARKTLYFGYKQTETRDDLYVDTTAGAVTAPSLRI